jgi:hypothetical protein
VDHHQHLFSPSVAALVSQPPPGQTVEPIFASDLTALLDAAGMERAIVLSVAYIFGSPQRAIESESEKVEEENNWTSEQVGRFSNRLRGFCSINPLRDYALEELARCANKTPPYSGLKLHFANSGVDYHDSEHLERLRHVFKPRMGTPCRCGTACLMGGRKPAFSWTTSCLALPMSLFKSPTWRERAPIPIQG